MFKIIKYKTIIKFYYFKLIYGKKTIGLYDYATLL